MGSTCRLSSTSKPSRALSTGSTRPHASDGSACTSGTLEVSHVLKALGLPLELARGSLRLTTGQSATDEDVERVVALMPGVVERVRAVMPALVGARE